MITKDNLADFLLALGYKENKGIYSYEFKPFNYSIKVDFNEEKIIYPEEMGLIVNERQTCNFSDNENFVVLECVHRLLKKKYNPAHIEIEKRWSLGHTQKSGRADICVMNETGNDMLLIIECKTYGDEFSKALNILKEDGGQLFSYYQQEKSTKWLMLYATGFKDQKIDHQVNTIPVFDTEEMLEKSSKGDTVLLYGDAHSKEKAVEVWKTTYEQKSYGDLIFSDDTIAYNIGEKPLKKKDLKAFNPRDKIVNKFEEILRHNNVSDKENAFNKLTVLFICKLVDEINKDDEDVVEFKYQVGTDTYETLLDRLQRLYTEGMDKFMNEEIFYVPSEYPNTLFRDYEGHNRKNAIDDLRETFRKLKFYSNSDFAFKDVHNETLFEQNGKIVVEVVKLFEKYRIVYPSKHQFLGDLFEQLLNQGFKQNEGQFFTPIPITRFIWESLPLENLKQSGTGDKYPKVIDYACGSGHFLTEGIDILNLVHESEDNDWVGDHIFGIEKDYRLARVSKISLFMNGAGDGNIVFGDGLDNHKEMGIENNKFDILVANPPYSVRSFKSHLKLKDNDFELLDAISNEGSEIEVLFVERISQLLKPNGVAAVILPSSLLSNSSAGYIGARESILKNFRLVAIAQFGDKTFGATGTNTVVLFLEKYHEPPKHFKMVEDHIQAIFNHQISKAWQDEDILKDYVAHIGVDIEDYIDFLEEKNNYDAYKDDEYLKMYVASFLGSSEYRNLVEKSRFKNASEVEQLQEVNSIFYSYVKEIEKDKLFYFALIRKNETLVIKAPSKNTEQYKYLGYKWSNRKGSEGIQIQDVGGLLYDEQDRESNKHIAPLIRKAFNDETIEINEELEEYASVLQTKNMLDFEREKFDKAISLIEKDNISFNSAFEKQKISEVISYISSGSRPIGGATTNNTGYISLGGEHIHQGDGRIKLENIKYIPEEFYQNQVVGKVQKNDILICKDGAQTGKVALVRDEFNGKNVMINEHLFLLRDNEVTNKFVFYLFLSDKGQEILKANITGSAQGGLNKTNLSNIEIPVPPINIQEKIVSECEKVEEQYETTRMKIEDYQEQIREIFEELEVLENSEGGYRLSDLNIIFNPSKTEVRDINNIDVSFIPMEYLSNDGYITKKDVRNIDELKQGSYKYFKENDVLIAKITPCMENGKCAIARDLKNGIGFGSSEYHVFRCDDNIINPKVLFGFLNRDSIRKRAEEVMTGASGHRRVPISFYENLVINLPSMEKQKEIVNKVEDIEDKIKQLEESQVDIDEEISGILNHYLA